MLSIFIQNIYIKALGQSTSEQPEYQTYLRVMHSYI